MPKIKFITIWIALSIIAVFLIQNIFPNIENLLILNKQALTEPWRFFTAVFLHASISHLLSNLFALILFGLILEKIVGSKNFIYIFISSAIFANIVSFYFYPESLGASGAIMGIIGVLTVIRPLMAVWAFGMIIPMIIAAVIWVIIDTIGIFIPSNIGHIAHISGIFWGIFIGIILKKVHEDKKKRHTIQVPEHILRRWETLYMN